jgi:ribose 5-phosphate isomerase B
MYEHEEKRAYFESAKMVASKVSSGEYERGILCCGTGMGMAIVANKFKGVYAAVVESSFPAKMAKVINNANILTIGGWLIAPIQAFDMVDNWLNASFTEGFPEDRQEFLKNALNEIKKIEDENFK